MKIFENRLLVLFAAATLAFAVGCDDDSDEGTDGGTGGIGGQGGAGGEGGQGGVGGEGGQGGAGGEGGQGGAGGEGGQGGAGGEGGVGGEGGEGGGGGRDCNQGCECACEWLADCAQDGTDAAGNDLCEGVTSDEERDAVYDGCLPACDANMALATIVNGHTSCEQTVPFIRGANADFEATCAGGGGGEGGEGGAGGEGGEGGEGG